MSTEFSVPQVTQDDLLEFHSQVFGNSFQNASAGETEEHGDGLGYYPDGKKRTLTDEQVKIFRHSEIHALLQEHRRKAAATLDEGLSDGEIATDGEQAHAPPANGVESSDDSMGEDDEDDEAEYALFLENERKEFEASAAAKRREANSDLYDRTVSTRRRVREMDAVESFEQALNYGDEEMAETAAPTENRESTGRKIWWPSINK